MFEKILWSLRTKGTNRCVPFQVKDKNRFFVFLPHSLKKTANKLATANRACYMKTEVTGRCLGSIYEKKRKPVGEILNVLSREIIKSVCNPLSYILISGISVDIFAARESHYPLENM